jgi:glycosyltransferase involved in cell wall biosynthesis
MPEPLLSVLLPNYNNGPYLKECLDSLFNQTFTDFKIFFVDDCSTDNSVEIAESYKSDKLVIIRKDKNSGIVDALNAGLEHTRSKYFVRMDGDDISRPDRFEKLVSFMENNPSIDICTSNIQTFGLVSEITRFEKDVQQNKANLIFCHTIGHPSSIFRTRVLTDNGIRYKNDFWRMEDYQLFYRLKNLANCTCLDEELYLYRRGEYNVNEEIKQKKVGEFRRFYAGIFDELKFNYSENDMLLHLELGGVTLATRSLGEYKSHVKKILAANASTHVFPQRELKICFQRSLERISFWLIDLRKITFFELFPLAFRNGNLLKYYFLKKFKPGTKG